MGCCCSREQEYPSATVNEPDQGSGTTNIGISINLKCTGVPIKRKSGPKNFASIEDSLWFEEGPIQLDTTKT